MNDMWSVGHPETCKIMQGVEIHAIESIAGHELAYIATIKTMVTGGACMHRFSVIFGALLVAAAPAAATVTVPIAGLVNSGVTAGNTGVTSGTVQEQNWMLGSLSPWNGTGINSNWAANNTVSRWMTPTSNANQSFNPSSDGFYTYTLDFDLTGFVPTTANFAGRFLVDNKVTAITLNGNSLLSSVPAGGIGGFRSGEWTSFSALTGFVGGINTLAFVARNQAASSGNPTGLRVEITSSAVNMVPEPASWAMLIFGFGLVGAVARRRAGTQMKVFA